MIAPKSIASRKTIEPVIATTRRMRRGYAAGAHALPRERASDGRRGTPPPWQQRQLRPRSATPSGVCPAEGGDQAAGSRFCGILLANKQKKCTESVSPSSSSPDRPSPKRLPGGSAFNLRRSVLGAIGKIAPDFACVKHIRMRFCRKLRQSAFSSRIIVLERSCDTHSTTKMHRARCSLVRLSTDRRRSDCLSESHQPRALRSRCTRDTRASRGGRQASCKSEIRSLRTFLYTAHTLAFDAVCSTKDGTKDSPSRVRFRPLPRLTFRFRVRPSGRASSYSRPVLGAAAIYALAGALRKGSCTTERPQIANDRRTDEHPARRRHRSRHRHRPRDRPPAGPRRRRRWAWSGCGRTSSRRPQRRSTAPPTWRPATSATARTSRRRSARIADAQGPIDAFVAVSGIGGGNGEDDEGGDRFDDLVRTNLYGTYYCVRAALRRLAPGPERAARRRDLVDPRAHRRARVHGVQRVQGRAARARPLARRRARARQRPGERDLPRLGRHGHGAARARPPRARRSAARATTPTGSR